MPTTERSAPGPSDARIAVQAEDGAMRIYDLFPIELPDHASCRMTLLRIAAMPTNVAALLD